MAPPQFCPVQSSGLLLQPTSFGFAGSTRSVKPKAFSSRLGPEQHLPSFFTILQLTPYPKQTTSLSVALDTIDFGLDKTGFSLGVAQKCLVCHTYSTKRQDPSNKLQVVQDASHHHLSRVQAALRRCSHWHRGPNCSSLPRCSSAVHIAPCSGSPPHSSEPSSSSVSSR